MGISRNLRYRLLGQVLTVLVLVLLIYTFIWITITKNQLINASSAQLTSATAQADVLINNYISNKIEKISLFANLQSELNEQDLQTLLASDNSVHEVTMYSPTGTVIAYESIAGEEPQNSEQSTTYKIASFMGGKTYISQVFQDEAETFIHIAVPLKTSSGMLLAKISLSPLWKSLSETVFIVNKNGIVQYHPDKKNFPFGKDISSSIATGNASVIEKDQFLIHSRANEFTQWNILAQVSLAEILKPLDKIYSYAALLFTGAVLFVILLSLTLTNNTITAFRNLKAGFDNFTRGNLAFRVPVSGNGELQELSRALNGMIGQIHEAYLKVDQQKQLVEAEKAQARSDFAAEKERMQHVLSDDREKVNYGLFVEKEKVNVIMANITDAIILLSKKREILFYNKAAEDLLGHPSQEMQHKLITAAMKLYEKDTEVPWDEYVPLQSTATGIVCAKEKVRIENPSIAPRFAKLLTIKTNFNEQDDLGYIIVLHNLNQEIELEKTEMRFVGRIVNELKSALTIILQCLPSISQDQMDEAKKMYLTGIQSGVDQISLLMQNFQLAMQLENQTVKPNAQQIDITQVISEVFDILNPQIQTKFLTVNYHQPEEKVSQISVDPSNVRDLLLNLLSNAIKFTPTHGVILVDVKQLGNDVLVEVQDNGAGIPKEHIANLFNKFFTVPDPKLPESVGAGLGLYIAKSLVELNNGKIWADSIEDKGSTFGFSFPKAV